MQSLQLEGNIEESLPPKCLQGQLQTVIGASAGMMQVTANQSGASEGTTQVATNQSGPLKVSGLYYGLVRIF